MEMGDGVVMCALKFFISSFVQLQHSDAADIMSLLVFLVNAAICIWVIWLLRRSMNQQKLRKNIPKLVKFKFLTGVVGIGFLSSFIFMMWSTSTHKWTSCVKVSVFNNYTFHYTHSKQLTFFTWLEHVIVKATSCRIDLKYQRSKIRISQNIAPGSILRFHIFWNLRYLLKLFEGFDMKMEVFRYILS